MAIETLAELYDLLSKTELSKSKIAKLAIPESTQSAFAIEVPQPQMLSCWRLLRSLIDKTNMYPLLTYNWIYTTRNWQEDMNEQYYFLRSQYLYEQRNSFIESVAPESIANAAKSLNGEVIINKRIKEYDREDNREWWESKLYLQDLEATKRDYRLTPSSREVETALNSEAIITDVDFERWLFAWELENVPREKTLVLPDLSYQEWFDGSFSHTIPLLLLPTPNSWETLAYIHFYGSQNSTEDIAILKYWHDKYDTELVAHYGTMLQFFVNNKPPTPIEAYELAAQHYEFAPCTLILPGVAIREHAKALLHLDRWFLHEKP